MVNGVQRHVVAYLRDFLFEERQALQPVKSLSGGERSRLLAGAAVHAAEQSARVGRTDQRPRSGNARSLEEVLADYEGTLLLVSHDRDFLDRLVTSVIALEGDGRAAEYVGGYGDYLRQRPAPARSAEKRTQQRPDAPVRGPRRERLSWAEQRDLEALPHQIEKLSAEIAELERRLADAGFYARDPPAFTTATERLEQAAVERAAAEERWLQLEEKRERLG